MRRFLVILSVCFLVPAFSAGAQAKTQLKDEKARKSYSLGFKLGSNLKTEGVEVDKDVLLAAFKDGLEGKKAVLTPDEMREILQQLQKDVKLGQERHYNEIVAKNREEGNALLEANRAKKDIVTLPSGLQYKVLQEGNGPSPKETDTVEVNYRGTLPNGAEFDSSYARGKPATLRANAVIKGWTEALPLMKTGSKWQLFVPPELAYADRKMGRIPPGSTLVFEIELLSIKEKTDPETTTNPSTQGKAVD